MATKEEIIAKRYRDKGDEFVLDDLEWRRTMRRDSDGRSLQQSATYPRPPAMVWGDMIDAFHWLADDEDLSDCRQGPFAPGERTM